jgi:hypothetical protein
MSENLVHAISDAVSQVAQLPIEQQPGAFGQIRDLLEAELNGANTDFGSISTEILTSITIFDAEKSASQHGN